MEAETGGERGSREFQELSDREVQVGKLFDVDALLAHDREHSGPLEPAEKLQQALDLMRAGIRMKRPTLRRQFPETDEVEADRRLAEWLREDG